jgi:agmatine/peptidylarginine deiminase
VLSNSAFCKCQKTGDYGNYNNYYVGNQVVVVPAFRDPKGIGAADVLRVYRKVVSNDFSDVVLLQ